MEHLVKWITARFPDEYYTDRKRMGLNTIQQTGMLDGKIGKINIIMINMFLKKG